MHLHQMLLPAEKKRRDGSSFKLFLYSLFVIIYVSRSRFKKKKVEIKIQKLHRSRPGEFSPPH